MTQEYRRRWTATITIYANASDAAFSPAAGETLTADRSRNDLQREQAADACGEAAKYLLAGLGKGALVQMYKTTLTHGTVPERSYLLDTQDAEKWARKATLAGTSCP